MTKRSLRLALAVLALLAGQALAEPARLVVTGRAEIDVPPDHASFSLTVRTAGREAERVLSENARRSSEMLRRLRASGIELATLQTRGVRLDPQWSPRPRNADADWRPEIVGYTASNRIEVATKDLASVGTLLAAAVEAGANGIDSVRFSLEDDRVAREGAIRDATARALGEARVMATAAGLALGDVLELRLDHAHTNLPQPQPAARMAMAERMVAEPMPVEAGEIQVSAAVTLTLEAVSATGQ